MSEVSERYSSSWFFRLAIAAIAAAICLSPRVASAQAPDKAACVAAYDKGQTERKNGALMSAKREFSVCADAACPDVTKGDCTTWSADLERSVPSVTFIVKDAAGSDLTEVAVTLDGNALASSIGSAAVEVDPGSHRFRFEAKGLPAVEQTILLREGEKNRQISVVLAKTADGAGNGGGAEISPATWVLAGVGGAGLVVFGVLGGLGLSEQTDAETTCAPRCGDDVIDPIRTKFIAADVALSIGLTSLGAALAVGLVTGLSGPDKTTARFELRPGIGGGVASFALGF